MSCKLFVYFQIIEKNLKPPKRGGDAVWLVQYFPGVREWFGPLPQACSPRTNEEEAGEIRSSRSSLST